MDMASVTCCFKQAILVDIVTAKKLNCGIICACMNNCRVYGLLVKQAWDVPSYSWQLKYGWLVDNVLIS